MNSVEIPFDSGLLKGDLIAPENTNPNGKGIIFLHGWLSNKEGYKPRAKALADIGYTCLTFDLPGQGESEGDINNLTRKDYLDSTINVYDYFVDKSGIDSGQIGVVGASFGGYLAALLSAKRDIRWLGLRAPANYEDKGFDSTPQVKYNYEHPELQPWRERVMSHADTSSLQAIHDFQGEVLVIESEKDTIVPHQSIQNYADAVPDPTKLTHIVMQNADHRLSTQEQKEEFIQIIVDWFLDR